MNMKRFTGVKGMTILIVLVVAMLAYYSYLSNRASRRVEEDTTLTKVQSVLVRNLELNYPLTPKEVIKYYGEITTCLYDGKCSESDVDKLAAKAIQLYDAELVENNPWAEYIIRLQGDVENYKQKGMTISNFVPAGSTSVDRFTQDGFEWARIYCTFYIKKEDGSKAVNEIFLLRKDEQGLWKIYGWDLAENVHIGEDTGVTEDL